jgi:hypothetical protein
VTFSLVLALITASVPCEPFATVLRPGSPQASRLEALGWTPDGRLIGASGFHFFQVDLFAHGVRWVADASAARRAPLPALRNTLEGPPGVFFDRYRRRLFDATGTPLTEVVAELRTEIERWPRLEPHGYTAVRVARTKAGEWLIIGYPQHRSVDDYRVFHGHSPRLEEHPPQKLGMGLDGGSVGVMLALDGKLVHWSFYPPMNETSRLDVNVGPRRIEDFVEVSRRALSETLRFSCLEPLPHERWWPEPPPN